MSSSQYAIAISDNRPFFETVLLHGLAKGIIDDAKVAAIGAEAPKGIVQIADAFGSKYLRPEIELARRRIVNLVSLYLAETSQGDLNVAAKLIRDNTFLTLSRGGSGLLKTLFAMPEYAMLGREQKGRVEDFLEFWSLKEKPLEYRQALAQRQSNALEIEAGFWFGEQLGITRSEMIEDDVDSSVVVRTALLLNAYGKEGDTVLNQIEFAQLLEKVRSKATAKKTASRKKATTVFEIPEKFKAIAERIQQAIVQQDLPQILDTNNALDKLVFELKDRYYILDHEIDDTSDYDALVAKEWTRVTKGKTDIDSLLTLFLCMCAGITPKTTITEAVAKTMVKKFRNQGFDTSIASDWIKSSAPHEKQESLLQDWDEFIFEAKNYLLDEWDENLTGAMRFLRESCHIEKAAKKA
jgi:hypothetical protein